MRTFKKKDGSVIQLIDKEKMQTWPIELPMIFIEYIRNKLLDTYGDVKKDVEIYLDEIMQDVAIPRLINVLEGDDNEEIILALNRIEEISRKNPDIAKPIKKYLNNLLKSNTKEIQKLSQSISDNFVKADRKKELAKKRKIMQQKEKQFLEGKINAEEYAEARKEYLLLKE